VEDGTTERVVCFWLGRQQFGAPIGHVKETIVLRPITHVFLTPPWLAGIVNLRGDIVAVVDLPAFFGLGQCAMGSEARIVIAHSGAPERKRVGFLVDRLAEVKAVEMRALQPTSMLSPEHANLAHGVLTQDGGAPLTVLDVPKLFESERLRQFQRKA
jgi:purine-binding chemotaxis protein CheW